MGWALSAGVQALFKGHLAMYHPALQPFIDFTRFHSDWLRKSNTIFQRCGGNLDDRLPVRETKTLLIDIYTYIFLTNKLIIMMYIYHVLINALSAHMIHINLNMIFYTHVEHSPTKTIYIKYYTKKLKQIRTTNTHTHTQ